MDIYSLIRFFRHIFQLCAENKIIFLLFIPILFLFGLSPLNGQARTTHDASYHHPTLHASQQIPTSHDSATAMSKVQALIASAQKQHENMNKVQQEQSKVVNQSRIRSEAAHANALKARMQAQSMAKAASNASAQLRETDIKIIKLDEQIENVRQQQFQLKDTLDKNVRSLAPLLPLADRLSLSSSETLLATPMPQKDTLTALLILRGFSHNIEKKAQIIQQKRQALQMLNQRLSQHYKSLAILRERQALQRNAVRRHAIEALRAKENATAADNFASNNLHKAVQKASSLQEAIAQLDSIEERARTILQQEIAANEKAHEEAKAQAARQQMARLDSNGKGLLEHQERAISFHPVQGELLSVWGHKDQDSDMSTGLRWHANSASTVAAPCSGATDFSGDFRSYGKMVILNCGRRYRFILAGLANLEVSSAQPIKKGQIIGRMGTASHARILFLQLRYGEHIINPTPFL